MPYRALTDILTLAGRDMPPASQVRMDGADPVLATQFRVGAAGAATIAATGLAVSDIWKLRTGREQTVSIDLRTATAALRSFRYTRVDGGPPTTGLDPVMGFYEVRDGRWVFLHCNFPDHRRIALHVLGAEENADSVAAAARGWDGEALETEIVEAGGCASFVRTLDEWDAHPQSAAIADIPVLEIERIGDAPRAPLPDGPRPLSGVRALDLTRVVAGPTCGRTLAEHGADVLKITKADLSDSGLIDVDTGFGKRAAHLDLDDAGDIGRMRALIAGADVFTQAYRPGALAARGLAADDVAAIRPGIVYVTLSAWGHRGPWRGRRGFDTIVQAATGLAHASAEDGRPKLVPAAAIDYVSGYLMAYGAMEALRRRAVEGGSWLVRVSLAGSGRWIRSLGRLPRDGWAGLPDDLGADELDRLLTETPSDFGLITHLGPAVGLSETPPFWALPPAPLGTHAAEWPDRAAAPAATSAAP